MSTRTKKYILKAAKDSVHQKFTAQVEEIHEQIDELKKKSHIDESGNPCQDVVYEDCTVRLTVDRQTCESCEGVASLFDQVSSIEAEWHEWTQRAKKNKKKKGKQVEWTNTREQAPTRTVNKDALADLRAARRETTKPTVGMSWLHEGALVTKRGQSAMMIVTRIVDNQVECLKEGSTQWFRNVALRPADWLMED